MKRKPDARPAVAPPAELSAAGLRYVSDTLPGLRRVRSGSGFSYRDAQGRAVRDARVLARIRALAVPPAYREVWICADPNGHLQATGRDARGRKQYRYHARWRDLRDDAKFGRMRAFGRALPRIRRCVSPDLALPGLQRDRVLALVVALLDATRVRIGNPGYARDNGSFGLTTLRSRHARVVGRRLRLCFPGKGGTLHDVVVSDARLANIVRRCQGLPGQPLFQYLDDDGVCRAIDSGMVNDYLRAAAGEDFTAKDFRTWGATVRAAALLARMPLPCRGGERARTACCVEVIRRVAQELRNTPAVCKRSYINPLVFEGWRDGRLQRAFAGAGRNAERATMRFLGPSGGASDSPRAASRRLRRST